MTPLVKYISIILIVLYSTLRSFGQTVVVENLRENNLTIGIDNEIIVAVENVPCSEIEVEINNGLIKPSKKCGHFLLVPLTKWSVTINIYRRRNGQLTFLDKRQFRTKESQHHLFICIENRLRELTLKDLGRAYKVKLMARDIDWDAESVYKVEKFKVELLYKSKNEIKKYENIGNLFSTELISGLKALEPTDSIVIHDVYILTNNNYQIKLEDLNYLIVE